MISRSRVLSIAGALLLAAAAIPAMAQGAPQGNAQGTSQAGWQGWGLRVGASANADQIFGGVHFNLGEFAPDVRFRPTVEIGFGDDRTLVQALAEVHYVFSNVKPWSPYVGGGLGITYVDWSGGHHEGSDAALSVAAIGGIETRLRSGNGLLFELKVGLGDHDPDLKFAVGWSFK
jgi:hypothetical protein